MEFKEPRPYFPGALLLAAILMIAAGCPASRQAPDKAEAAAEAGGFGCREQGGSTKPNTGGTPVPPEGPLPNTGRTPVPPEATQPVVRATASLPAEDHPPVKPAAKPSAAHGSTGEASGTPVPPPLLAEGVSAEGKPKPVPPPTVSAAPALGTRCRFRRRRPGGRPARPAVPGQEAMAGMKRRPATSRRWQSGASPPNPLRGGVELPLDKGPLPGPILEPEPGQGAISRSRGERAGKLGGRGPEKPSFTIKPLVADETPAAATGPGAAETTSAATAEPPTHSRPRLAKNGNKPFDWLAENKVTVLDPIAPGGKRTVDWPKPQVAPMISGAGKDTSSPAGVRAWTG